MTGNRVGVLLVVAIVGLGATPVRGSNSSAIAEAAVTTASPGLSGDTIRIGIHIPLTGPASVPSASVEKGKDLYYRWLRHTGRKINGRMVEVVLRNDQYNPSAAVSVCKEMVEKANVFALLGYVGPDQIQACARYAASVGVPYISLGSTAIAVKRLDNYFAVSKTWPGLGRLLADLFVERLGAKTEQNGMVRFATPNYEDAHDRFVAAMTARDAQVHYDRAVSKAAGLEDAEAVATEMNEAGIDSANVLASPVWFLQLMQQAAFKEYYPMWTSVDAAVGIDAVSEIACRREGPFRARILSPFPAWADRDRFDPKFGRAVRALHPREAEGDSTMWHLWAFQKVVAKMLDIGGRDLTRARFINRVERSGAIRTGILPSVDFSPTSHFGGRATHVLKPDCADKRWDTAGAFVRNF